MFTGMSQTSLPGWAAALNRPARSVIGDETSRGWAPLNVVIDLHKLATGPFVLVLMLTYDAFTPAAWTYLALHGSYGIAWVLKDVTVGDRKWRHRVGLGGVVGTWAFLTLYWVAPVILVLGSAGMADVGGWIPGAEWTAPGAGWLAVAVVAYVVGLVLMVGADVQKNATLRARERRPGGGTSSAPGLITTGFYARTRHPNYLGEMLVYGAFALVAGHWLPWLILAAVWGLFFVPNMLAIDASLSRYPGYAAWRGRTGFLLPKAGSPGRSASGGPGSSG